MAVAEVITKSFSVAAIYDPSNPIVPALIERRYSSRFHYAFRPNFFSSSVCEI